MPQHDLHRLFDVYCKIDQDFSGQISTWELLEYLHLERTKFTKRIFRIFDEDGSGQIDFREVRSCYYESSRVAKNETCRFVANLRLTNQSPLT